MEIPSTASNIQSANGYVNVRVSMLPEDTAAATKNDTINVSANPGQSQIIRMEIPSVTYPAKSTKSKKGKSADGDDDAEESTKSSGKSKKMSTAKALQVLSIVLGVIGASGAVATWEILRENRQFDASNKAGGAVQLGYLRQDYLADERNSLATMEILKLTKQNQEMVQSSLAASNTLQDKLGVPKTTYTPSNESQQGNQQTIYAYPNPNMYGQAYMVPESAATTNTVSPGVMPQAIALTA
jgi:hypothetical protein